MLLVADVIESLGVKPFMDARGVQRERTAQITPGITGKVPGDL